MVPLLADLDDSTRVLRVIDHLRKGRDEDVDLLGVIRVHHRVDLDAVARTEFRPDEHELFLADRGQVHAIECLEGPRRVLGQVQCGHVSLSSQHGAAFINYIIYAYNCQLSPEVKKL